MAALPAARFGGFQQVRDFVDQQAYLNSEFYGELMEPHGRSEVSMMFLPGAFGMLSFGIDQDTQACFEDAVSAEWIAHQIKRCFDIRIKASAPGANALLVDAGGRPLGCRGREVETITFGTLTNAGPFEPVTPTNHRQKQEFLSAVESAVRGQSDRLVISVEEIPYQVDVTPGPHLGPWHVAWIQVQALQAPQWSKIALIASYGLTPREASVVMCLIDGLDIPGIATHLHLRPRSVSTYLANVFSKTQSVGQVDLLRKLLGGTRS
jgi:DNA-binding CsgD family transcriptional regulator